MLLVDDEPAVLASITRILLRSEFAALSVTSGQEALDVLAEQGVEIVISDERMPGMAGTELLEHVRERYPDTVRILLTGNGDIATATRAINDARVHRFLQKPCRALRLLDVMREALTEQLPGGPSPGHPSEQPGGALPRNGGMQSWARQGRGARLKLARQRFGVSAREGEVLTLLDEGLRVSQIGQSLCISPNTVRNHLRALSRKLGAGSQAELIAWMRQSGGR